MIRVFVLAIVASLSGGTARALAQEMSLEDAAGEVSSELAQCAAFYQIGLHCFADRLDEKSKKDFEEARSAANTYVYMLGKKAGMSDKALLARNELAFKSLRADMDSSCVNISVALNQYAEKCKSLVGDPSARLLEMITKGR